MSQASIVMPKESTVAGIAMKADVDPALAAISTLNAGDTDPGAGPGAYAFWADTGTKKLKQRNADNTAWNILCDLGAALAALSGSTDQTFLVAEATEPAQAVNLGQLNAAVAAVQAIAEAAKSAASAAQSAAESAANAANPAGSIIASARAAAPDGYLLCDGSTVSRTTYAALFSAIGTAFGSGDGATTFALPDLRGVALRGVDGSRGFDSGRVLGSYQADAIASHSVPVTITDPGHVHPLNSMLSRDTSAGVYNIGGDSNRFGIIYSAGAATTGITAAGAYKGAAETRMKNVAVNYFIKA